MQEHLDRVFQNYLGEFLLTKDDVRRMRAKVNRIYSSKEAFLAYLQAEVDDSLTKKIDFESISDSLFVTSKIRTMRELDTYEAKIKE